MKKIKFPASVVMILSAFLGMALMLISEYLFVPSENMATSVIGSILSILGGALVSAGIVNFFVTISTVKEIQAQLTRQENFEEIEIEELRRMEHKITKAVLQKKIKSEDLDKNFDVQTMLNEVSKMYWIAINDSSYLKQFKKDIQIIIHNDKIEVVENITIVYINLVEQPGKVHRLQSTFFSEAEAISYKVKKFQYQRNGMTIKTDLDKHNFAPHKSDLDAACWELTPWTTDISARGEHKITMEHRYETKDTVFFQSRRMLHNCEDFSVIARLIDRRSKGRNGLVYKLRWNIICGSYEKYKEALDYSRNQSVRDSVTFSCKWFPKESGYAIALNSYKET